MGSGRWRWISAPDIISGFATVGVCAFLGWQTMSLPAASAIFPDMVLGLASCLGVLLIIGGISKSLRSADKPRFFKNRRRFFVAVGLSAAYLLGVDFVGFYTSSTILIPIVAVVFGYRKPVVIGVTTVVYVLGMYIVLTYALGQQLPTEIFLRR